VPCTLGSVDPALRLGLEIRLEPAPASPRAPGSVACAGTDDPIAVSAEVFAGTRALSEAAFSAGFGSVWLSTATPQWMDPTTVAGALTAAVPGLLVGVVVSLDAGRHPAVVAREVTSVDVVSRGRAALRIRGGRASAPALAEAAQICRSLFRSPRTTFAGSTYCVEDAPNRPAPVRIGGPLLLVDVEGHGPGTAAGCHDLLDRGVDVDAMVVGGSADDLGARLATWTSTDRPLPALLWRGALDADLVAAARTLRTATVQGAAGVIVGPVPGRGRDAIRWIRTAGPMLVGASQE